MPLITSFETITLLLTISSESITLSLTSYFTSLFRVHRLTLDIQIILPRFLDFSRPHCRKNAPAHKHNGATNPETSPDMYTENRVQASVEFASQRLQSTTREPSPNQNVF